MSYDIISFVRSSSIYSGQQGRINCGPSSQSDFIQIYFLFKRMFRFFRHSRQIPYFNVSRQKVTHFNVLGQKVTYLDEKEEREKRKRETGRRCRDRERGLSLFLTPLLPHSFLFLFPLPLSLSSFSHLDMSLFVPKR